MSKKSAQLKRRGRQLGVENGLQAEWMLDRHMLKLSTRSSFSRLSVLQSSLDHKLERSSLLFLEEVVHQLYSDDEAAHHFLTCPSEIWEHLQLKCTLILRHAQLLANEPQDHEDTDFSSSKGHSARMTYPLLEDLLHDHALYTKRKEELQPTVNSNVQFLQACYNKEISLRVTQTTIAEGEEHIEREFGIYDGIDIAHSSYSSSTTIGALKMKLVPEWPHGKKVTPKSVSVLTLIHVGRILENNKTLADSRISFGDIPGGAITMHVVIQPPYHSSFMNLSLNPGLNGCHIARKSPPWEAKPTSHIKTLKELQFFGQFVMANSSFRMVKGSLAL
ncbi:hypothetical protein VNO77_20141 [Canavalia gladiata]|uniref:UBL3-like ubiquitin domain-containing protein n=1 Tax=Canavalia gladiata TaxID=3824 RepID=A0AAN9QJ43_CANGL